ncbi:AsmA family protein [Lutibaculum baratangense]|uniref:AsmA domain-containing protein n=1 Tax=Lutibaculum baratangense AMV1 TaxID=631454 RepID=V4RPV6_9HYPH|nr:AsmA family protein [Lutibaculum baratangense]ESR27309.1 hypothetical protein N177_0288 [Lutibaculum baratangense AMV1]
MNAFLLSIGIVVAALLSAAFAVPMFIDWNSYRSVIEEQAGDIIGRPVVIEGDIDVRLVPTPILRASDVHIGGKDSGEGVGRLSLRGGLMPLLSGELQLREAALERPNLRFSVSPEGFVSWGIETEPATIPIAPQQVTLDRFEIIGGRVTVEDARRDAAYTIDDIELTGSAASLAGPYKFRGAASLEGERYELEVALGSLQPDGSMRIGATARPDDSPVVLTLDGSIGYLDERPRYRGLVRAESRPQPAGGGEEAQAQARGPTDEDEPASRWRFEARTEASPGSIVLQQLGLEVGDADHPITLSGAAEVQLGREARFEAVLSSRQIDVDRALGGGPEAPVPPLEALGALGRVVSPHFMMLDGRLSLDVGSLVVGGNVIRQLEAQLAFEDEEWRIGRAQAVLPGDTSAALSGRFHPDPDNPSFVGAVRLAATHASPFTSWLFREDALLPGLGAVTGDLQASASVRIADGSFALDRLEVTTDRNHLTGSIAYASPAERADRIDIVLNTDAFDTRGLPLQRLADTLRARIARAGGEEPDIHLDLDIGELSGATVAARDVVVRGVLTGDRLDLEALDIGNIAGLEISAGGELADLGGTPTGQLQVRLTAQDLTLAAEAARIAELTDLATVLEARGTALSPLTATLDLSSRTREGEPGLDLRFEGTAAGTDISSSARLQGRLAELASNTIRLEAAARSEEAGPLLAQLGLGSADVAGEGAVELSAHGSIRSGLSFVLSGETSAFAGSLDGTVAWPFGESRNLAGALTLEVRDPSPLEGATGLPWLSVLIDQGTLRAQVAGSGTRYEMSDLSYEGQRSAQGSLVFETGAQPGVHGAIVVDEIALDRLLTEAAGMEGILEHDVDGPSWRGEPFSPLTVPAQRVSLEVSASRATWEEIELSDASLRLLGEEGRIALRDLDGRVFDGRLEGSLELQTLRGVTNLSTHLHLKDVALGEVVWRRNGRPWATGRADLALQLSGGGRTPASLVSSLAGEGSFLLRDVTIRGLDPSAFQQVVRATEAELEVEEEPVAAALEEALSGGAILVGAAEGAVSGSGGTLRAGPVKLDSRDLEVFASAAVDLEDFTLDSNWTIGDRDQAEGRAREAILNFSGPIEQPMRTINVRPLISYLTVLQFEREMRRLEEVQAEILERERLGRELLQLGRERRQREREASTPQQDSAAGEEEPETNAGDAPDLESSRPAEQGTPGPTPAPAREPESLSLDRDEFRRTIQDLLRGIDQSGSRSGVDPQVYETAVELRGSLPLEEAATAR